MSVSPVLLLQQQLQASLKNNNSQQALGIAAQLLKLAPRDPQTLFLAAQAFESARQLDRAIEYYFYAGESRLNQNLRYACLERATDLSLQHGLYKHGLKPSELQVKLRPEYPKAQFCAGLIAFRTKFLPKAIGHFEHTLSLSPGHAWAMYYLGCSHFDMGAADRALEYFQKAMSLDGSFDDFRLMAAYASNCVSDLDDAEVAKAHFEAAKSFEARIAIRPAKATRQMKTSPLRIGLLSPDFYWHSVAYFLYPAVQEKPEDIELYCYADGVKSDSMTEQLKNCADKWRNTAALDDEKLVRQIQVDEVDVLLDLNGMFLRSRIGVFARKPAPVQVSYLGYPNTSGLSSMDYRISDERADPMELDSSLYTEQIVRLPHGFLCYLPDPEAPEVAELPALNNGYVTFGAFNSSRKITSSVIEAWSHILLATPDSRLLFKAGPLHDEIFCEQLRARFEQQGVAPERLELLGWTEDKRSHLDCYSRVDIHLDTFPYNGTTTTCEALWQGVPTVCIKGDNHRSRVGFSLMTQMDMTDWVADDVAGYVSLALKKAADLDALAKLRKHMRSSMQASALMDKQRFGNEFYGALKHMYANYVEISSD